MNIGRAPVAVTLVFRSVAVVDAAPIRYCDYCDPTASTTTTIHLLTIRFPVFETGQEYELCRIG
jgi:hypothetical protein